MSRIMCTQTLWTSLGQDGRPPDGDSERRLHGVALGGWAAKMLREGGRQLVLAMDERTRLALVFPLSPRKRFRENFTDALRAILEDLGVPPAAIAAETEAIAFEPLCRLSSRTLVETLSDLQYICEIELMYHDDLRVVQCNLNDLPLGGLGPCVSKEAVVELLGFVAPLREPRLRQGSGKGL
jgi:hypothetical protein